ncbi:MAG: 4a-hydroxytetrahydrobiopterin dehydratase [Flavobacteriaceae bacterium]|nr:4a-hydroxytetrahydrobiopterin dehydratase [Flavobacteriaceae bacterium]
MQVLSKTDIDQKLNQQPLWKLKGKYIFRTFTFEEFIQAIEFINKVAGIAETQNHHPEIKNNYTSVQIKMTTHDANGITKKDFALALAIDQIQL